MADDLLGLRIIGNVNSSHHFTASTCLSLYPHFALSHAHSVGVYYSQLQQCAVGVAVDVLLLALLCEVALETAYGLGVVSFQTIDNGRDVLGPLGRVFAVHDGRSGNVKW